MRSGSSEYANAFEGQITDNIGEAAKKLEEAVGALAGESAARRDERALESARALVRGMEGLRDRMAEQAEREAEGGEQGQQGQGGRGERGERGERSGQPGSQPGNQRAGDDASPSGDPRQYAREFGLRRQNAESLRELARAQGVDVADLDRVIEDLRRLESGRPLGDPRRAAALQAQVIDRLKAFEFGLYRQLTQNGNQKAALGARSPVPTEYRAQVEEYYRSLARPQSPSTSRPPSTNSPQTPDRP